MLPSDCPTNQDHPISQLRRVYLFSWYRHHAELKSPIYSHSIKNGEYYFATENCS